MAGNYSTNPDIYMINGIDIADFGAICEYSKGFFALPPRKSNAIYDWPDEHGVDMDLNSVFFKERDSELSLIITGSTYEQMLSRVNSINAEFMKPGMQYIKIANTAKIALVLAMNSSEPEKLTTHNDSLVACRVVYKLTEPYPLNRQFLASTGGAVSFTITGGKIVTVDWGDKTRTINNGINALAHDLNGGPFIVTVYGGVDAIYNLSVSGANEIF